MPTTWRDEPSVEIIRTSQGSVEIARWDGQRGTILFFPGGHCSATADCGQELYTDVGYGVISFSRPGYGHTEVGSISPASFTSSVREVCDQLGIDTVAASVGVSFGGMQAIYAALDPSIRAQCLVLHSAAPSSLPYPDTPSERLAGPIVFSPVLSPITWLLVRGFIRSDRGLRLMIGRLSKLPASAWWPALSDDDRAAARRLFGSMRSQRGFVTDLREGSRRSSMARTQAFKGVTIPALVTASRSDRGVSFEHAVDSVRALPHAHLVETSAPTHLFWLGDARNQTAQVIDAFLSENVG